MISRRIASVLLLLGAPASAFAQNLPAPAPVPATSTPLRPAVKPAVPASAAASGAVSPGAVSRDAVAPAAEPPVAGPLGGPASQVAPSMAPQSVPATTPQPPTPDYAPAPPSQEFPLVVGEPARDQGQAATSVPEVGGISIAGLSDSAAVWKLKSAFANELKRPLRLVVGQYQYTYLRSEVGATIPFLVLIHEARDGHRNVPLRFTLDAKTTWAALADLDDQVREDFTKTALNIPGSYVRIKVALAASPTRDAASLLTRPFVEAPTADELAARQAPAATAGAPSAKFPYLMSEFATHYVASLRGRTTNLKIAARNINGHIVAPDAIFSANHAIGPRNAAAGWKEAMMFVSGKVVSGTGSGICQCASTLYNAALLANLPIVERHAHSMRVTYVPVSRDAALMWGSKDFKFRNNTGAALYMQTFVNGGKFHVRIWADKPVVHPAVRLVSQIVSKDGGTHSVAYKYVGNNDKVRISRDFYMPHP